MRANPKASFFAFGRFGHRPIYQKCRQVLGSFIQLSIRFLQAVRIVTFDRGFDFPDQGINLSLILCLYLVAD